MLYKYQEFNFPLGTDEDPKGIVNIQINPKRHIARVVDPSGIESEALLRDLLIQNDWSIHTVALSETPNTTFVSLIRGEQLLNWLKEPGTHADSVMHLLPLETQKHIKANRDAIREMEFLRSSSLVDTRTKIEAAGVLLYCSATNRFLLCKRGKNVSLPGVLATFGGKLEPGEDARTGALRELHEEAGLDWDNVDALYQLVTIEEDPNVIFYPFLLIVNEELECHIDETEVAGYEWLAYNDFQYNDMHPGITKLFAIDATLKKIIGENSQPSNVVKFSDMLNKIMDRRKPTVFVPSDDLPPIVA
jgi:8-oxo-dGTP pyrophosphatase MutT (NUDIX family)